MYSYCIRYSCVGQYSYRFFFSDLNNSTLLVVVQTKALLALLYAAYLEMWSRIVVVKSYFMKLYIIHRA